MTEPLTPDAVRSQVDAISGIAGDEETAHVREDELHVDVLSAIADGRCTDVAACARLALTTLDIDFDRWYA